MPTYLQGMVQLHDSSNMLAYQVLLVLMKVNLLIRPCIISVIIYVLGETRL